jgi:hypothetical protein
VSGYTFKQVIEEEWADSDGYWIALKPGFMDNSNPHYHTIREDTKKEARDIARFAVPCNCKECKIL